MKQEFMKQKQIQNVIDGFNKYYKIFTESKSFNAIDFKEYMEPIFTEAGYRYSNDNLRHINENQNILIITDAAVGDFILTSAAIREIRRIYPKSYITLIISTRTVELAENCPYVDEIIINEMDYQWYDLKAMYLWNINFARKLLEKRFDICYAFNSISGTIFLAYMSGAKERLGTKFSFDSNRRTYPAHFPHCHYFSSLLTVEIPQQLYGSHIVDTFLGYVDFILHAPVSNRDIEIWYTPVDITVAKNLLKNCKEKKYAFTMGGSGSYKYWSPEGYAELMRLIIESEKNATIIILGGSDDMKLSNIVKQVLGEKYFNENILDLTGKTDYRQSAAILSICDCYIGNNTGTMNAAAAVKIPVISTNCFPASIEMNNLSIPILFSPYKVPSVVVQPKHALPECKDSKNPYGCRVRTGPHCITQIKVKTMFKAFKLLKDQIAKKIVEPIYIS